jgi:RNA polymerase sigma factor (sigma-70 family)
MGTIVSFYTNDSRPGQSFILARVASILCQWGFQVLLSDWNLDQPRLLSDHLTAQSSDLRRRGLTSLVDDYVRNGDATPERYVVPISQSTSGGRLDLLPVDTFSRSVTTPTGAIDWAELYSENDLGRFIEDCRATWVNQYDFTLVDCPAGVVTASGICMAQLPDILVFCVPPDVDIAAKTVAVVRRAITAHDALPFDRAGLMVVPVILAANEAPTSSSFLQSLSATASALTGSWLSRDTSVSSILEKLEVVVPEFAQHGDGTISAATLTGPQALIPAIENLAALIAHRLGSNMLLVKAQPEFVAAAANLSSNNKEVGQQQSFFEPVSSTVLPTGRETTPTVGDIVGLVEAARDGSKTAWRALVDHFDPGLRRAARRYGLDEVDVDDAVQQTWLSAVTHLARLRASAAIAGWLHATLRRECLRITRARRGLVGNYRIDATIASAEHPGPEAEIIRRVQLAALREAVLQRLPTREQELMALLTDTHELSYVEIAQRLDVPVGSIGPTRARALQRLRRLLDEPTTHADTEVG